MPGFLTKSGARAEPAPRFIALATANARYGHSAFGLRWLWANLGPLRDHAAIHEFHLGHTPLEIAESLLKTQPLLVGLGIYVWNLSLLTQVVGLIKAVRPEVTIVLGGPEITYEYEGTNLFAMADYLIRGEGELAFANLAPAILEGKHPPTKVIEGSVPELAQLALPYDAYTEEDLASRILYVEASRGCPFGCEFCLSSLDPRVREFPLPPFLDAMERLIERGARRFTFVDRTFNLRQERVSTILKFYKDRWQDGMQLHFEILPDRLTEQTLELFSEFPPGGLHLEVGIQSFNAECHTAVSRRQNLDKTIQNLRRLRTQTGALVHADLIVGLPGESWDSFAEGFDRLIDLEPQEIQIELLKLLKGTSMRRHVDAHAMAFSPYPPYEILQTDLLDFTQVQRLRRFARYFDLYYNSGNFPQSLRLLWQTRSSPFTAFMELSDRLWAVSGRTHQFALAHLAQHLYTFLVKARNQEPETIASIIEEDYHRLPGRREKLHLRPKEER